MKLELDNKSIFVSLGSEIDSNRFSQISTNAKIVELHKPNDFIYFEVENISSAKKLCKKFIAEFNLGGSNWIGGRVIDEKFNFIAKVSYNGRVWDNEDWSKAKEIEL
ncbi:hypothetical protein ACFSQP_07465 [Bizionia sediminis]|uniref:Uncharacterized protein n=1 Tax=Bizionia sediminis TaxID=1737064 RepID=A0ABW5KTE5_9FLAO